MKVLIIAGGFSSEAEASRMSAENVSRELTARGHKVTVAEFDTSLPDTLRSGVYDVAFPLVAGKHHGDGAIQALLALYAIPYVGSPPYSAAIINHKTLCKQLWRAAGLLTPDFFTYSQKAFLADGFTGFKKRLAPVGMALPVVVKPPTQGNRFGMVLVEDEKSFAKLAESFAFDDTLLVEKYVPGRFFTQGLIEISGTMTATPPMEVLDGTPDRFKLYPGGSEVIPCTLGADVVNDLTRASHAAAEATGARGYTRLDYHLHDKDNKLYLIEINAVPGLVPGYSSMPACAAAAGYSYGQLLEILIKEPLR